MNLKKVIPFLFLSIMLGALSCSEDETLQAPEESSSIEIDALNKKHQNGRVAATQSTGCGAYFSGTYTGSGYYTYPDRTISLCSTAGGTITISCTAIDVPNRFNVYDQNGSLVATTGWIGYTSNPGPWGYSGLNGPSSKTISFTKSTSSTYKLRVETVTQGISDAWEASVGCTNVCPTSGGDGGTGTTCTSSCGTFQSGNYGGSGYYTYPDRTLTFCAAQNGKLISINCQSIEVPNRFTVYDGNGNYITSSGWIGYSSNPGPWGSSLNGPAGTTISFIKSSSVSTYKLRLETVTQGITDAWEAGISCQP